MAQGYLFEMSTERYHIKPTGKKKSRKQFWTIFLKINVNLVLIIVFVADLQTRG